MHAMIRTAGLTATVVMYLWTPAASAAYVVGERYPVELRPSTPAADTRRLDNAPTWEYVLRHPGATYIAPHFSAFDLGPNAYLVISDGNGDQAYVLVGKGKLDAGTFWSRHVKGDTAILRLYGWDSSHGSGFEVDEYAAGFADLTGDLREICGADDKQNAACFATSYPTEYARGRAVCRLLSNGTWFCTGWLASHANHVITNEHCVTSPEDALNTDFDFMAEAPNCADPNCPDCYPGTVYSGGLFVQDSVELDYALLQVAEGNPAAQFGYLELETRTPRVGEEICLIGHPAGRAKEFSLISTEPADPGQVAHVQSLTQPPCMGGQHVEVGYYADTVPGSSGSPVLSRVSQRVVALHHCGVCLNRGVPTALIYPEIAAWLQPGPAGTVHFDWNTYGCAALMDIDLRDGDLAGTGVQQVTVSASGGDTENLTLQETGPTTAFFTGTIATAGGPVVPGDGVLQVGSSQTAVVTYLDADDGHGGTGILVTDDAQVDCEQPDILSVAATTVGALSASITLTADEPVSATVHYGLSCGSLDLSTTAGVPDTSRVVLLTGLTETTTYFYAVSAEDRSGNVTYDDNGGQCYTFTTLDARNGFTELFSDTPNDTDYLTIRFVPDASPDGYHACVEPISALPTNPSGGLTLSLGNDGFQAVPLFGSSRVWLYGVSYSTMYIGANGYVTFTAGDTDPTESLADHFDLPRVSGLFANLNPAAAGRVAWEQLGDRAVVTFVNVPESSAGGANTFQFEFFFDGRITLSYLNLTAQHGLAGLSNGLGLTPDFRETDLSAMTDCSPPVPGDIDDDGDVDLTDADVFIAAMNGPGQPPTTPPPYTADECLAAFDFDADEDLDLGDFAGFQIAFTGDVRR